jgi:single-strand DNA-binding protein
MASVNKCIFIGNLGADPESRFLPNGDAVSNFRIACSDSWKDKDGSKKESTEWVTIDAFGKLAEICNQYLKKGASVYIEGSLRTRKWQDKEGNDRYTTSIKCSEMKMLGSKSDGNSRSDSQVRPAKPEPSGDGFDFDSDAPF